MMISFRTEQVSMPQRHPDTKSFRSYRIALAVVVGVSLLAITGSFLGDGGLMVIYQQNNIKKDLLARIAKEEERQRSILAYVGALKEDPFELERVAREELGLVKENEIVYDFR